MTEFSFRQGGLSLTLARSSRLDEWRAEEHPVLALLSPDSLVAIWKDARAQLIPNALGEFLTPSCVSLDEDGTVLVGRAARERLQTHPERTAVVFKRYMGSSRTARALHPKSCLP